LRFNFLEFIIIFMGIITNDDKHFYLVSFKKRLLLRDMNPETSHNCKMIIFGLWTSRRRVWSAGLIKHKLAIHDEIMKLRIKVLYKKPYFEPN
jgi:hypothetical protein